jgi:hypothetical protein
VAHLNQLNKGQTVTGDQARDIKFAGFLRNELVKVSNEETIADLDRELSRNGNESQFALHALSNDVRRYEDTAGDFGPFPPSREITSSINRRTCFIVEWFG